MAASQSTRVVETWKSVPETTLEVSDQGNVRHLDGSAVKVAHSRGYTRIYTDGAYLALHRLVLECFEGPANGRFGLHRNDDPADNRLCNLYWGTQKDNAADRVRNGTQRSAPKGSRHHNVKLTPAQVAEIRARHKKGNGSALAREFGVSPSQVHRIVNNIRWKHL